MSVVLGVDIGGTFTDFFAADEDGSFRVFKRPSTPDDPARAVLEGLAEAEFAPEEIVHGSTVATNVLLERRGARTALVTTRGFRDVIVIGRQARRGMYALEPERPEPLVPADGRFEVEERIGAGGETVMALADAALDELCDSVARWGAESVAVCLLFSFLRPEHERRVAAALGTLGIPVSASVEVLPEYREYERWSTTAVNAYLAPVVAGYLERLQKSLSRRGVRSLRVMQSDGGSLPAETAGRLAVRTVLSGPAGGVAGAFAVGAAAGFSDLITFDMGGTSTDVSLCPGRVLYRNDFDVDGLPVRTPAVDLHTVGAGGGSIAALDAGGALRVGPASAGADPGPACYGQGLLPTVTDAHVVLGRIRPERFLDARLQLDAAAAGRALAALRGGGTAAGERMAAAVLRVANANMERAIRVISVERGFDPRRFTLLAFGGAGPLHACDLAEALRIPRVLVPPHPGVLSAFGMVVAGVTRDYVAAVLRRFDEDGAVEAVVAASRLMEEGGLRELKQSGETPERVIVERSLDLRYEGQSHEIDVAIDGFNPTAWASDFHAAHAALYGHGHPGRSVEVVNARVRLRVPGRRPPAAVPPSGPLSGPAGHAPVWFGKRLNTPIFAREHLPRGAVVAGPAVVTQMDATTVINPGWQGRVDAGGNLLLERG